MLANLRTPALLLGFIFAHFANGQGTGGVYIDSDRVLRFREPTRGKNTGKLQKIKADKNAKPSESEAQLTYVSLPKLFAELEKHVREGSEIPEEVANIAGITKVK